VISIDSSIVPHKVYVQNQDILLVQSLLYESRMELIAKQAQRSMLIIPDTLYQLTATGSIALPTGLSSDAELCLSLLFFIVRYILKLTSVINSELYAPTLPYPLKI
jgi:hypothetical protein